MGFTVDSVNAINLYGRVSQLLESHEWSDCTFSISGTIFKAHKLLLGISSPVFKAMFYGPLSKDEVVVVCDINPNIFQLLLNYIYTDKIDILSVEQAFELLYAAKKYIIDYVANKCIKYIEDNISVDNVITILNLSEYVQEEELFNQALQLFSNHFDYFIENGFHTASVTSLRALLKCHDVNVPEYLLIQSFFKWSKHFCANNYIKITNENRRKILIENGMMQLLRFLVLTVKQLDYILKDDNLLLPTEVAFIKKQIDILHPFDYPELEEFRDIVLCKISECRLPIRLQVQYCYRTILRSSAPLIVGGNCNKVHIRIRTNKTIFINSLNIRARSLPFMNEHNIYAIDYKEDFFVTVKCEANNIVLQTIDYNKYAQYDSILLLQFTKPCVIKKGSWYKISFVWRHIKNNVYKYSVCHRMRKNVSKVQIEFDDVPGNYDVCGSFLEALSYTL